MAIITRAEETFFLFHSFLSLFLKSYLRLGRKDSNRRRPPRRVLIANRLVRDSGVEPETFRFRGGCTTNCASPEYLSKFLYTFSSYDN